MKTGESFLFYCVKELNLIIQDRSPVPLPE